MKVPKPNALFACRAELEREAVNEENAWLWLLEMNHPGHMRSEAGAPTRLATGSEIRRLRECRWLPDPRVSDRTRDYRGCRFETNPA